MSQANRVASTAWAAGNSYDGDPTTKTRETWHPGMDDGPVPRRYSNGVDLSQRHNGEPTMSANYHVLANWGYSIIWASGEYCQAIRDDRDATFQWNGERWVEL